jgi:hypothetical protein
MLFRTLKNINIGFAAPLSAKPPENDTPSMPIAWQQNLTSKKFPGNSAGSLAPLWAPPSVVLLESSLERSQRKVALRSMSVRASTWDYIESMTFQLFEL